VGSSDSHITRAADWTENRGREISSTEWQAYAASDPELSADPRNGPNAVIWTGHPTDSESWLDWSGGNVYSGGADTSLIDKMQAIAERLDARLVDDDNQIMRASSR